MRLGFFGQYRLKDMEPGQAERHIRRACLAGLIAVVAVGAYAAVADPLLWADAVLMGLLLFGLWRRNVPSAVVLVVYFAAAQFLLWATGEGHVLQLLAALLVWHFLLLGMLGVIRYRKEHRADATFGNVVFGCLAGLLVTALAVMIASGPALPSRDQSTPSAEESGRRADYESGYEAGYADGRSGESAFGARAAPPEESGRRKFYEFGYLEGYTEACGECPRIEQVLDEVYEQLGRERRPNGETTGGR